MGDRINSIGWPYYWLEDGAKADINPDWAVFFGADFKNIPDIDIDVFAQKTNNCLDYIRKNCRGCRLIYRPHPDEKDEHKYLNLESFSIEKDGQAAENFLWDNREKIKYTFSVCSTSSIASFNMGFNSYGFYNYFRELYAGAIKIFVDHYFGNLPDRFFINNLNEPLRENKITLKEDIGLKENFHKILTENNGPVWFIVAENRFMLAVVGLANMMREIFPERRINLIISGHHRWSEKSLKDLDGKFDKVMFIPRHFYSLKPRKILNAFKAARSIKKINLGEEAVLVGFAHHDFIENCFMSYNRNKFKVAFLQETTWNLNFKTEKMGFDSRNFRMDKASRFYNYFFEPFLGLNRTLFVHHGQKNFYFIRLQEPLEKLFDQVYLIKDSPIK